MLIDAPNWRTCFSTVTIPWPAAAFLAELKLAHNHYVAARADGALVGYAGISRLGAAATVRIRECTPSASNRPIRDSGIGRRLLDDLLAFADGSVVFLEVRTDNAAAISLYESVGFVQHGGA